MTPQDPNNDEVFYEYDWEETSPSKAITESVNSFEANTADVGIDEERTPLYDYIDSEALETIATTATHFSISFPYADYIIQIDSNGVRVAHH